MGLDMYLEAKRSLYNKDWTKDEGEKTAYKEIRKLFPEMFTTDNLDYTTVGFEAGYWRKANAIHKWFVDNCQEGEDDCRTAYVSTEQLIRLKEMCQEVIDKPILKKGKIKNGYKLGKDGKKIYNMIDGEYIENPDVAKELLPTESGCFYGSYEFDDWYIRSLKNTIETINKCLKLSDDWSFYYHSSW